MAPAQEIKEGRRLLTVSRTYLKRILYLAYAYRITGHGPYMLKAKQEMLAASNFTSWNPSHYLDVAEMAMGLAIGYDWLFDELGEKEKEIISTALLEKGIQTSLDESIKSFWVSTSNNWNPVCHGGLMAAAIAIFDKSPNQCSAVIQRGVANVPKAMKEYSSNGNYPEGPMYWEYGTTYTVLLIDALQTAFSRDFGLLHQPGFLDTPNYYRHTIGPSGLYFNYSDCHESTRLSAAQFYFSKTSDCFLPFLMLWAQKFPKTQPKGQMNILPKEQTQLPCIGPHGQIRPYILG